MAGILGWVDVHTGTPLRLVAAVAEAESLYDFRLFAFGTTAYIAPLITRRADGFADLVAHFHRFDLATLEAFHVRGRVFAIAVRTDGFAGLTVLMDGSALSADTTNNLHGCTSFQSFGFGKSSFRSPNLTSYPTL